MPGTPEKRRKEAAPGREAKAGAEFHRRNLIEMIMEK